MIVWEPERWEAQREPILSRREPRRPLQVPKDSSLDAIKQRIIAGHGALRDDDYITLHD